jgi:hypothetical protein
MGFVPGNILSLGYSFIPALLHGKRDTRHPAGAADKVRIAIQTKTIIIRIKKPSGDRKA